MQINLRNGIPDSVVTKEFHRFLSWTGERRWAKKIEKLAKLPQLSEQNLYVRYLARKNPLTSAINEFFLLDRSGKSVARHASDALMKAAGYVYVLNRIIHQGSGRLESASRGSLLDDDTVRSFLFEIDIATHFFRRGFDVEFTDLEGKANCDLLVSNDDMSLEIECKRKSADAGRKIARSDFFLLADILFSRLKDVRERFLIDIDCEGRMGSDQMLFSKLADELRDHLHSKVNSGQIEHIRFEITYLPSDLVIRSNETAAEVLAPYWAGSAHFGILSGKDTTLIIKCESTKADRVLKAIYEELREGATQFSNAGPAVLACFIEDIDDAAWSELAQQSGLRVMTHKFFSSGQGSHVWRVVYSSDQTPVRRYDTDMEFHATTLSWENPNCRFSVPRSFLYDSEKGGND